MIEVQTKYATVHCYGDLTQSPTCIVALTMSGLTTFAVMVGIHGRRPLKEYKPMLALIYARP